MSLCYAQRDSCQGAYQHFLTYRGEFPLVNPTTQHHRHVPKYKAPRRSTIRDQRTRSRLPSHQDWLPNPSPNTETHRFVLQLPSHQSRHSNTIPGYQATRSGSTFSLPPRNQSPEPIPGYQATRTGTRPTVPPPRQARLPGERLQASTASSSRVHAPSHQASATQPPEPTPSPAPTTGSGRPRRQVTGLFVPGHQATRTGINLTVATRHHAIRGWIGWSASPA